VPLTDDLLNGRVCRRRPDCRIPPTSRFELAMIAIYSRIVSLPSNRYQYLDSVRAAERSLGACPALLEDPCGSGADCTPCSSQSLQRSFLTFGHPHEVFSRFDIELLSRLVTDLSCPLPQLLQTHCCAVQVIICSTLGRSPKRQRVVADATCF
jgi:hypothetical protein